MTIAMGDLNATFPCDHRLDLTKRSKEFNDDQIGAWIQSEFVDFRALDYEGYSRADRHLGAVKYLSATDHVLCDLHPI